MSDELTIKDIAEYLLQQRRMQPCKSGYVNWCGCGMVHDYYGMCKYHREILLSDSNLVNYKNKF